VGAHFIAWIFLCVMGFSLGYYERGRKVWSDDTTYVVEAQRTVFGAPRPWLAYTAVISSGAPPPVEMLPGGIEFVPGVRVDVKHLALAVSSSLVIAFVLFAACLVAWPDMRRRGDTPTAASVLAIALCSAAVGAVSPTEPAWIGSVLGLAVLPAIITGVCWKRTSALPIVLLSAVGVACMVWFQRLAGLVWSQRGASHLDVNEFIVAPTILFTLYALLVMAAVAVRRVIAR
jgi:hypothetical protein